MNIADRYKFIIEDRLNENNFHKKENDRFLKLEDEHNILYKQIEEVLQEEHRELLDELNSKNALINLEENYLSYIIGLSDGLKLRNMLDKIV